MASPPSTTDQRIPRIVSLPSLDASDQAREIEAAAMALRDGMLVALPTETVFGIFARASDAGAIEALRRAKGGAAAPLAWHLPGAEDAAAQLGAEAPADHLRLVRRLCPGPVTFAAPLDPSALAAVRARVGVAPGVFDDGRELLLRVPDRRATQAVLSQAGVAVVAAGLEIGRSMARDAPEAVESLRRSGGLGLVDRVLDDGSTAPGKPSTLVRLQAGGGFTIARPGAYEERFIRKQLGRTILFVCTGNTCRSPMAEAAARAILAANESRDGAGAIRVRSAGVGAAPGQPVTPESVAALAKLGIELRAHASTALSRDMIEEADVIFAMTRGHAEAIRLMAPGAANKLQLMDPQGRDIPDPIGQGQEAYDRAARVIVQAVEERLRSLGAGRGGVPLLPGALQSPP